MMVKIGCIVEGHGEVASVPILIRRVAASRYPELTILIRPPIRIPRNRIVRLGELERVVELASRERLVGKGLYSLFLIAMMTVQRNWDLRFLIEHHKLVTICQLPSCSLNTSLKRGFLQRPSPFVGEED